MLLPCPFTLFKVGIDLLVILLALISGEKAGSIFGEVKTDEPCDECLLDELFEDDELVVGVAVVFVVFVDDEEACAVEVEVAAFTAGEFVEEDPAVLEPPSLPP